jgi:hypothetical protein
MVAVYAFSERSTIEKNSNIVVAERHDDTLSLDIPIGPSIAQPFHMDKQEFQRRTKRFGLDVIALIRSLPTDTASAHIARQLVRSGTGVGANYRHACRAKSNADFVAKMGTVRKKRTSHFIGSKYSSRVVSLRRRRSPR